MSATRKLLNVSAGSVVATSVRTAVTPWTRGIGLLGRKTVAEHEGLWIGGCSAIHTVGMRATIDVVFLDADGVVLKFVPAVPPQKLVVSCRGARTVVELGVGGGAPRALGVGDKLVLE